MTPGLPMTRADLGLFNRYKSRQTQLRRQQQRLGIVIISLVGMYFLFWEEDSFLFPQGTDHIPACTFAQLENAFGHKTKFNHPQDCWSLKDEILRVPIQAIINRRHLEPLGHGFKGSVHKAVLQIDSNQFCTVAVKSDHCHTLHFYGFSGTSCLQPYTFLWNAASYVGGEYTGALPFYAHHQEAVEGLLPTWAVVEDRDHPQKSRLPRSWLAGAPHPDPAIKGVVMPYVADFVPLSKWRPNQHLSVVDNEDPLHLLVRAAKGLEYLHHMGLVVQDILPKNIGVHESTSFLYDNTYLSLEQPPIPKKGERETNFCIEPVFFSPPYMGHRQANTTAMESDVQGFVQLVVRRLSYPTRDLAEKHRLWNALKKVTTASKLVHVLSSSLSNE